MNENVIAKVQKLLERAGHSEANEAERDACLAKADELMNKYRIERAMLNFDHREQSKPIVNREVEIDPAADFADEIKSMMARIFRHAGCQVSMGWRKVTVVGYEEDIVFGSMLWADVHREFVDKMFPRWDAWRDFDSNVQRIKDSGRSWMQIVEMAPENAGLNANSGSRLRSAYKREYARLGLEATKEHTRSPQRYRQSFASAFETELASRLRHYDAQNSDASDIGDKAALAVRTDNDRIREAFYDLFPNHRPKTAEERAEQDRKWEEERKAEEARRAALTDRQREAEDLKADREAERNRRYWARYDQKNRRDALGSAAGKSAANGINLDRSGRNIGRTDKELA